MDSFLIRNLLPLLGLVVLAKTALPDDRPTRTTLLPTLTAISPAFRLAMACVISMIEIVLLSAL